MRRLRQWLFSPQPIERLELLRILLPLVILGFLSSRLWHSDEWIGTSGFHVPPIDDWRQPLYVPPLASWAAWSIAALTALSGLSVAIGFCTRVAAALFAFALGFLALADRLEAFTVTKLAPVLMLALLISPAGARFSVDAWRRRTTAPRPTYVSGGSVRFFQIFLPIMYSGSGIAKLRGDWLHKSVLYSHLHDSYQTGLSCLLARSLPAWTWWGLQAATLLFEVGAPLWFALPWTRRPALFAGLMMHALIGLMFGPVIWFALLMSALLLGSFAPLGLIRLLLRD